MTKYMIEGGRPLFGELHISGAKNAAVAIIPAALMVSGPCRIENIPQDPQQDDNFDVVVVYECAPVLYDENGNKKENEVLVQAGYKVTIVIDPNDDTNNSPDVDGNA